MIVFAAAVFVFAYIPLCVSVMHMGLLVQLHRGYFDRWDDDIARMESAKTVEEFNSALISFMGWGRFFRSQWGQGHD